MASLSQRLAYVLTFDTASGVKSLEKFGKTAENELGKAEKANLKLQNSLQKGGAAAVAFAGVAGMGLGKLAVGASDARQNFQALEQVVGTLAAEGIKEWADGAAQSIGTTSSKAVEAATSFAQLGKLVGLGGDDLNDFSTGLVSLAADFSAFKNVSPEQALQDIRSGFSGSVETMRKYGIFLDEITLKNTYFEATGEKVAGTMTAQQRVLATNIELYKQGADMIGQFARESDSFVGQTAILKAELGNLANEIGEGVLPFAQAAVTVIGSLAEVMGSADKGTKTFIGGLLTIGVVGIGAIGSLALVSAQVMKMNTLFRTFDADGVATGLSRTGKMAKGSAIMMGAATIALAAYAANAYTASKNQEALNNAMDHMDRSNAVTAAQGLADVWAAGSILGRDFVKDIKEITRTTPGSVAKILELEDATGGLSAALRQRGADSKEVEDIVYKLRVAYRGEMTALANVAATNEAAAAAQEDHTGAVEEGVDAIEEMAKATHILGDDISRLDRKTRDLTEAIHDEIAAQKDAFSARMAGVDSIYAVEDAQDALHEAQLAEIAIHEDVESNERQKAAAARDTIKAMDDLSRSIVERMELDLDTTRGMRQWNAEMIAAGGGLDNLKDGVLRYIGVANDIPPEKITVIEAQLDQGNIDTARRLLETELSTAEAEVNVKVVGIEAQRQRIQDLLNRTTYSIPVSTYIPGRGAVNGGRGRTGSSPDGRGSATGTKNASAGPTLVGERGPEIVEMAGGERVINARKTREILESRPEPVAAPMAAPVNVEFSGNIYGVPERDFVSRIAHEIARTADGFR